MTIRFEYEAEQIFGFDYKSLLQRVVNGACDMVGCPYEIEVSIVVTQNNSIQEMNREYRGIDAPTDVLSFPMVTYPDPGDFSQIDKGSAADFNPETGELLLGDIMLNYDRVISQAEEYGHSIQRELAFLTAHSMLHLFGYDHIEEAERLVMEEKQETLMEKLGITRD